MIQVNKGEVKWVISSTDGSKDFTFVGKIVVTADQFDEALFHFYKTSKTYKEAYEKTEDLHEHTLGYRKYSDYNSYKGTKSSRIKHEKAKKNL